jgi:uncharacterized SAM-binding protein YcdF (DUF218 family)
MSEPTAKRPDDVHCASQGSAACRARKFTAIVWPLLHVGLVAILGLSAVGLAYDRHLVEKILTRLALPSGIIWTVLGVAAYTSWYSGHRKTSGLLSALWVLFTCAGSSLVSQRVIGTLESRFERIDIEQIEPFDVIVVLGGGTQTNPNGDVWLGQGGERLNLAASLYHAGKVRTLVTTGRHYDWSGPKDKTLAAGTALIWQRLGIPASAIAQLGGRNTSEEMVALRAWLTEHPAARVGVITSASHLPRALRLARAQSLSLQPIAADFQQRSGDPWPLALIPSSAGLLDTDLAVKEYLAALVGR